MVSQIHKNELKKEEGVLPLLNNSIGSCEALLGDWKGLLFMFQDDSIKEETSKIVGNFDDSNVKEFGEGDPFSHATAK